MRKIAFALAAMATALALCPAAMADSVQVLTSTTSSYVSTSVSLSNLGTWLTTINGSVSGIPTTGDPNPFVATYTESVYRGGADAMCATCLNFVFTVTNSGPASPDGITNLSTTNFGSFTVAEGNFWPWGVDYLSGGDEPLAGTVDLYLNTPLMSGQTADSYALITNASYFAPGTITFQDGTIGVAPAVVGVSGTPEPSSLLLLGTGILGLALTLFRKNKTASLNLR